MEKIFAYHFDLKRAMWTRSYMDRMVDRLKSWGFNAVVYEMEDKFRFLHHPDIAHPDAAGHEETADFVKACREKGVEVIPLIQSLGHAEYILKKPRYAHLQEDHEVHDSHHEQYDPLSDEVESFLKELFDEVIDVMQPKEYFHMGGDETWQLGTSKKCRPVVKEIGKGGLYLKHMIPLFEHLHKKGLRPVIWADMVLSHPAIIKDIPKYVVLMDWDYDTTNLRPEKILIYGGDEETGLSIHTTWKEYEKAANPNFRKYLEKYAVDQQTSEDGTFRPMFATDALKDMGFGVFIAPANRCCLDMIGIPLHSMRHIPNCFQVARKGMKDADGCLVTSWAIRHNHPEVTLPATFAASMAVKDNQPYDREAICRAFTSDMYGQELPEMDEAIQKAEKVMPLGESRYIWNYYAKHIDGDNAVDRHLENMDNSNGGRNGSIEFVEKTLEGYRDARKIFESMKTKARKNKENIEFWLEGVDINTFCAEFTLAALKGNLKKETADLIGKTKTLKEKTRALFAEIYTPKSVKEELELRYGFYETRMNE